MIFYLIYKDKNAREQAQYNNSQQEVAVEKWDDGTEEGDINNIVTYEQTETLPPDVDEEMSDYLGDIDNVDETGRESTETTITSIDDILPEDNDSENSEADSNTASENDSVSYILELNGKKLSTSVQWANLNAENKGDNSISYTINGSNVTLTLAEGSREAYRDVILKKAESLGANIDEEIISYSQSRIYDMYEYDKYTLTYFKNESDDKPSIVYYFVSDADVENGLVYLVTISTDNYIDSENEIFGILEYSIN